jgi:hypothetical protein
MRLNVRMIYFEGFLLVTLIAIGASFGCSSEKVVTPPECADPCCSGNASGIDCAENPELACTESGDACTANEYGCTGGEYYYRAPASCTGGDAGGDANSQADSSEAAADVTADVSADVAADTQADATADVTAADVTAADVTAADVTADVTAD